MAVLTVALLSAACVRSSSVTAETERSRLLELHAQLIEAHRTGNAELILNVEAEDYVVANRGEIAHPPFEQRRSRLSTFLSSTRFTEYVDVVPPVVAVSSDGTLGWVMVQVRAAGEQVGAGGGTKKIEYESAWVELYEKRAGRWVRIGNVANFKQ